MYYIKDGMADYVKIFSTNCWQVFVLIWVDSILRKENKYKDRKKMDEILLVVL